MTHTFERKGSRRATRSGREESGVETLFYLVQKGKALTCASIRFRITFQDTALQELLDLVHITKTNLDIVGVCQKHGQSVYSQAPPRSGWQTVFKRCTEVFIDKHCFIVACSFVLCESKHIQFLYTKRTPKACEQSLGLLSKSSMDLHNQENYSVINNERSQAQKQNSL